MIALRTAVLIWNTLNLYVVRARMLRRSITIRRMAYGMYAKYLNSSTDVPSAPYNAALTPKTITAVSMVEMARYNVCILCHMVSFVFLNLRMQK